MIYESRFSLKGHYRVAGIGEIASDITKNGEWVNAVNERGETPLHIAAKYKKFDIFNTMLPYFSKIEACDNQGNTVIHALLDNSIATSNKIEKKCSDLIEMLICNGCNVNKTNRNGWTPVHLAARNCQIEVLNILEKNKPDFTLRADNGESVLHLACKNMTNLVDTPTEIELINNLIVHGCDVNAKNDKGYSVLHYAVNWCGLRVVEKLIDCGADLDCQSYYLQLTPLHLATRNKKLIVIDTLIRAGANVNSPSHAGLTALHLAVIMGSLKLAKNLIDNGANVNYVEQWTPLHIATYLRRKDMLKLLIREQADVNALGVDGLTPLHLTSILGNVKFAKILIDSGANVNSRDKNNHTSLHLAIKDFHRPYLSRLVVDSVHIYLKDSSFSKYFAAFLNISAYRNRNTICRLLFDNGVNVNAVTKENESALHFAAGTGNVQLVKSLLKHGAKVDCQEKSDGFTPLHTATYWGHADVVKELMNANANEKIFSNDGKNALHLATFYNRVSVVKQLISAHVNVNITAKDGTNALYTATFHNHVDVVKELLNDNVDVNIPGKDGKSPLDVAVEKNYPKVFKLLFKQAIQMNANDKKLRNSPLHIAARENHELIIRHLIKIGSKVDVVNEDGFTPLHCAVDTSNVDAASILIGFNANVNCRTKKYQLTPLHLALQRKCYDLVDILLEANADVNVVDINGVTPLHLATLDRDVYTIANLIDRGANVHCKDKILQFTPLHIAVVEKRVDIFNILMKAGAKVNVSDKNGLTPLHLASILGSCDFTEILIDYGANINCHDANMYTPLHYAICNKRVLVKIGVKIYSDENSWISKSLTKRHEFVRQNYEELVEQLIHLGADLNSVTKYGESFLHFGAEANSVKFIRILLEKGFDMNCKDSRSGLTPLQTAVLNDNKETVVLLISRGADVSVVNKRGKGLLHLATESGGTRVLKFLLRYKSDNTIERYLLANGINTYSEQNSLRGNEFDVNTKDYFGMTPLHLAALHANRKHAMDTLLFYGASVNVQDNYGYLPIHYAIKNNRYEQLESLLAFGIDVNDSKVYGKLDLGNIRYDTRVGICMIQHVIKFKALEFPIADVYEYALRDLQYTKDSFYNECLKEIEKLKIYFVDEGVSLYNLLDIKRRGTHFYAKK